MSTIDQVAALAGTSRTSVSYVLNNRPGMVGPKTRQRILEAAKSLDYRPNRQAKRLRGRRNQVLTVQLDSTIVGSSSWRSTATLSLTIVQGICAYADARSYHLHLLVPQPGQDLQAIHRQVVSENGADGVILFGLTCVVQDAMDQLLDDLRRFKIPAVTLDQSLAARGLPSVFVDLQPGIQQAVARLAELGHRHVGYVGVASHPAITERVPRWELFRTELQAAGVTLPQQNVFDLRTEVDAYRQVRAWAQKQALPSCLIFTGDHLALAGLQALADSGIRVPDDVSVLSMNNAPYAATANPPLASIDHRYADQGAMLAKLLLDQVDADAAAPLPETIVLRSAFVERDSLGPCKNA